MNGSREAAELMASIEVIKPIIEAHADQAEKERRLPSPIVSALAEAGLFRMLIPKALGGFELDPLSFMQIIEDVSRIDGSTGWCLFIGAGAAFTGAFLDAAASAEIFGKDPRVITGGTVFPHGKAVARDGGYVISGRWPYASGCHHCSWLLVFCNVLEGDELRLTADGTPEVRVLHYPADQARIIDTWHVSGLAGTGSHDIELADLFVPEHFTWTPDAPRRNEHYQGPLYRYPFLATFVWAIGAVALGIAQHAVDACMALALRKRSVSSNAILYESPMFQVNLAEAVAHVRSCRAWFHRAADRAWKTTLSSGRASHEERADFLLAATHATASAAKAVDLVYTHSGGRANHVTSPLQRTLRDIHAVTQHAGIAPHQYEVAGRMLMGLEPRRAFIFV